MAAARGGSPEMEDRVQMRLRPSGGRRVLAVAALVAAGAAIGWGAVEAVAISVVARGSLAVFGVALMVLAAALWRATSSVLELTETDLRDDRGRVLARLADIGSVERGALSMAPTGGFVLRLTAPAKAHWAPGLWWRVGSSLGIGGTTPRLLTREMGLLIEAMIAVRKRGSRRR